jgi:hypothetical protein
MIFKISLPMLCQSCVRLVTNVPMCARFRPTGVSRYFEFYDNVYARAQLCVYGRAV